MAQWMRIGLLVGVLGLAALAWAGNAPAPGALAGQFSDELSGELYDCSFVLHPAAQLAEKSAVTLTLETGDNKDGLRLRITRDSIGINATVNGRETLLPPVEAKVQPGMPYPLLLMRRGNWLGLLHERTFLFRGEVPRPSGSQGGVVADAGWTVDDPTVQTLEPIRFSDDFMRKADENAAGAWTALRGEWALKSAWDDDPKGNDKRFDQADYSQNPFAWAGRSSNGSALCTTGKPYWEDYTLSVAVQPGADGAAGVMVNMPDATSGYLVRWTPANDHRAQGDAIALLKVEGDKSTVLAEDHGGYVPGQWYQLTVISSPDGVQVLVDGRRRLSEKNLWPFRGGIGLYTEGSQGAVFNDVVVNGRRVNADHLEENRLERIREKFSEDKGGMQAWAARSDWIAFPGEPSQLSYRCDLFGDHWMTITVRPFSSKTGELWLVLNGDGKEATSGFRAVLKPADGKFTYTIYRDATSVATKTTKPLAANTEFNFRFRHDGDRLLLEQDGETVLEAKGVAPLPGLHPSYRADGCFALAQEPMVLGHNVHTYTFSDEPVDWIGEGTWEQSTRWACDPRWSFLGGWSRGDAVLWHKQRFTGDQYFDVFLGVRMEYPRERQIYDDRYRDLGVTICGDGHNPRSGYAGIYLAQAGQETYVDQKNTVRPKRRFVLLRNGVEVQSAYAPDPPNKDISHHDWFELTLCKRGATVEFWVGGVQIFTYTDPQPIEGGVPAIWTSDNGISVALAELQFAKPPQPRDEARVTIDDPWYPEWGNIDTPLKLSFPGTWSTTGKPVQLSVAPHITPAGEDKAIAVKGDDITFTPHLSGDHWYQISASDGDNVSPAVHLFLPVFAPALGRDDSHAVLLYRFNEGQGTVVHDRSKVAPAVDLHILKDAKAHWLHGQGLTLHGTSPLMSGGSADKLLVLRDHHAATFEFWVSADTIYPSSQWWTGTLLSWEQDVNKRNLMIGHISGHFYVAPNKDALAYTRDRGLEQLCFRVGLQHYVVTWDGTTTRVYLNGKLQQEKQIVWDTAQWEDATLFLGNTLDMQHSFLGTYYLVAVHDRCLSEAEVLHNYQAGPSAK